MSKGLSEEINAATRQIHSKLNGLVIARLPLCLPPATSSPQLYFLGLSSFAEVYRIFELLWISLLRPALSRAQTCQVASSLTTPGVSRKDHLNLSNQCDARIQRILNRLYLPELLRTQPLIADLSYLEASRTKSHAQHTWRARPCVQSFKDHIGRSVVQKPHTLIAYGWVLYMALFSGGRWIHAQLLNAGDDFWANSGSQEDRTQPEPRYSTKYSKRDSPRTPLSFFQFLTPEDGEDIKREFKSRLAEVETALTLDERRDIVLEALHIFHSLVLMVEELDSLCESDVSTERLQTSQWSDESDEMQAGTPGGEPVLSGQKDLGETQDHLADLSSQPLIRPLSRSATTRLSAGLILLLGFCFWLSCVESFPPVN